jgi:hypothetical protein
MPGDSGDLAVNTRVHTYYTMRTRGCGCIGHPAFPAPFLRGRASGRKFLQQLGRIARREREGVFEVSRPLSVSPRRRPGPITPGAYCCQGLWLTFELRVLALWVPAPHAQLRARAGTTYQRKLRAHFTSAAHGYLHAYAHTPGTLDLPNALPLRNPTEWWRRMCHT